MYADKIPRLISYHDTWISVDPVQGCPYQCIYCVLRHANHTGVKPQILASPENCVRSLVEYRWFIPSFTPLAIGNETDMLSPLNRDYLVELLSAFQSHQIDNPIILITKASLDGQILARIRSFEGLRILFFLSYSGLGREFEPNFSEDGFKNNFRLVREYGFRLVHFWRPLLPENATSNKILQMLNFVSGLADASVIVGLKIHPELNSIFIQNGRIALPPSKMDSFGEWMPKSIIEDIYREAQRLVPNYPLYRHTACALARVLALPNHTATIYREDICLPSHCPPEQRQICESARRIPDDSQLNLVFSRLGRHPHHYMQGGNLVIDDIVSQEVFSFLLHNLKYPIKVKALRFENLYRGSIHANQQDANPAKHS